MDLPNFLGQVSNCIGFNARVGGPFKGLAAYFQQDPAVTGISRMTWRQLFPQGQTSKSKYLDILAQLGGGRLYHLCY